MSDFNFGDSVDGVWRVVHSIPGVDPSECTPEERAILNGHRSRLRLIEDLELILDKRDRRIEELETTIRSLKASAAHLELVTLEDWVALQDECESLRQEKRDARESRGIACDEALAKLRERKNETPKEYWR